MTYKKYSILLIDTTYIAIRKNLGNEGTVIIIDDADSHNTCETLVECRATGRIKGHLQFSFPERVKIITREELGSLLDTINTDEGCVVIANKGIDTVAGVVESAGEKVKRVLWLTCDEDQQQEESHEGLENGETVNVDRITPSNFSEMVGYYLEKRN